MLDMAMSIRGYSLPLFCGAGQARKHGLRPKKGSKGCYILQPKLHKVPSGNFDTVTGEELMKAWTTFKFVCVFNLEDLEGDQKSWDELVNKHYQPANRSIPECISNAEEALTNYHKVQGLQTNWGGNKAFYMTSSDEITMPKREQFNNSEGLYATWAHECVHSTGHAKRLNRNLTGSFGSKNYSLEELVAELGAYIICRRLNISSKIEGHASYLGAWIKSLKSDPTILVKQLTKANRAANLILGPEVTES